MSSLEWVVLEDDGGKTYLVELVNEVVKIKGLGVFNPAIELCEKKIGSRVTIGQKVLTKLSLRLPEIYRSMKRRAQTISSKDAGIFITRLGIELILFFLHILEKSIEIKLSKNGIKLLQK